MRVTIATGPVVVGDLIGEGASEESAVIGQTPNLAARLQKVTPFNSVVISSFTHDLCGARFDCVDLGAHEAKGFSKPVNAWRVTGESVTQSRFEARRGARTTPILGRRQELRSIAEYWDKACHGEGVAIAVSGEAGIGKSRLAEAVTDLAAERDSTCVRLQCSPYHSSTPLYPFTQELAVAANLQPSDSPAQKADKLVRLVEATSTRPELDVPLLASLLSIPIDRGLSSLPSPRHKSETMRALSERLMHLADEGPLYWLFEDLHWADPSSIELIEMMLGRIKGRSIMLVMTHRPDFKPVWRGHYVDFELGRLDSSFSCAMASAIAGPSLDHEMIEKIAERSDGVPLFVEEVTRTLLEQSGDRHPGHNDAIPVPATLQDSLMARLDRSPAARDVAQCASAIGREFSADLLQRVFNGEQAVLERGINALREAGLLTRRETTGPRTFVFKHALVQDTAYQSMLRRELRTLHERIALVLKQDVDAGVDVEDAVLAEHMSRAEMYEEAVQAWSRAARRSIGRSNFAEAIAQSEASLALLDHLPAGEQRDQRELEAQLTRGRSLLASRGWSAEETGHAYQRARVLSENLNSEHAFTILYGLYTFYLVRGECHLSMGVAEECLARAEQHNDDAYLHLGKRWQGLTHLMLGECVQARTVLLEAVDDAGRESHADAVRGYGTNAWSSTQIFLAHAEVILGMPNAAWRRAEASIELARKLGDPFDICHMLNWAAIVCIHRRKPEMGARLSTECTELAESHGLGLWVTAGRVLRAIFDAELGDPEQADRDFTRAIRSYEHGLGARHMVPLVRTEFARQMVRTGRLDRARSELEWARSVAEQDQEGLAAAERERVFGELLAAEGDVDGAGDQFQRAFNIASRRQEHLLALRAGVNLMELRNPPEGDKLLAPHLAKVQADGTCPDLQRALALLHRTATA